MDPLTERLNLKHYHLETLKKINAYLGSPIQKTKVIHVAGTNGKGSVVYKVAASLTTYKVGLFTSPHLFDIKERFVIDGQFITQKEYEKHLQTLQEASCSIGVNLSYFETCVMIAFLFFQSHNVDLAVVEVGLGGRLDATNLCDPLCVAITSIGLDHTEILGNTLEKIAFEKAGIIKTNAPVVLGPCAQPAEVFKQKALGFQAKVFQIKENFETFDEENTAIAQEVLIQTGLQYNPQGLKMRPPCRFKSLEHQGYHYVFDVAHNPAAFEQLKKVITKDLVVCLGFSQGKDLQCCVDQLATFTHQIYVSPFEHERSCRYEDLQQLKKVKCFKTLEQSLDQAQKKLSQILITGSFFMIQQACEILKINKERLGVFEDGFWLPSSKVLKTQKTP